jgi:hypothetical protein
MLMLRMARSVRDVYRSNARCARSRCRIDTISSYPSLLAYLNPGIDVERLIDAPGSFTQPNQDERMICGDARSISCKILKILKNFAAKAAGKPPDDHPITPQIAPKLPRSIYLSIYLSIYNLFI